MCGSSLVDATNELATSEQENRIVTHSIPQRPLYYHQRRMVTIHTLTKVCQCDLGDGDEIHSTHILNLKKILPIQKDNRYES
jgi:hypothetical protein